MIEKLPDKRIVGAKQTIKAIKSGSAEKVYIAEDAEEKVTKPIIDLCMEHNVEIVYIGTMQKLGAMCGIDVPSAAACIVKK
jgi:large subunit ribosomal protein L7A